MNFEVSERITTQKTKEELLVAAELSFKKIANNVKRENDLINVRGIVATFGSINRKDDTVITIRPIEGGLLLVADVNYRPSTAFWLFVIFTYGIGCLFCLYFYLTQRSMVRSAIEQLFKNLNNEFHQNSTTHYPQLISSTIVRPQPPELRLFVYFGNEVKGPYKKEQIQALLETGTITLTTQTCLEGGEIWKSLSEQI